MNRTTKKTIALLSVGIFVGVALTAAIDWAPSLSAQSIEKQSKLRAELQELQKGYRPLTMALNKVADLVMPSVVRIVVENKGEPAPKKRDRVRPTPRDFFQWFRDGRDPREFFKEFHFGDRMPQRRRYGVGSGIIIDSRGYILTNEHVIEGFKEGEIRVTLFGEKESVLATVKGRDPKSDLAVIKIGAGKPLPTLTFADPDSIKVGDIVVAVGHPFDYSHTMSQGIISHLGRHNALRGLRHGDFVVEDFIQTDAAINPGNSGGPLVNLRGEIVGVNSFIASQSGGSMGLGFAMSCRVARKVAASLIKHGKVVRGYLGVSISDISDASAQTFGLTDAREMVKKLKLKSADGALVMTIEPNTPAQAAGLRPQDVIVEFAGEPVRSPGDLTGIVRDTEVGAKVKVKVMRDGKVKVLTAKIAQQPDKLAKVAAVAGGPGAGGQGKVFGMTVQTLTPEIAKRLGMPKTQGVVVTDVAADSAAAKAGIEINDVIVSVAFDKITSAKEFLDKVKVAEDKGQGIVVNVKGKGMVILD